jgi:hypothetical protein
MIVSFSALLIVAGVIGLLLAIVYKVKAKEFSFGLAFAILFFGFAGVFLLLDSIVGRAVIIEREDTSFAHREVLFFGSPDIELADGTVLDTEQLGFKMGNVYCINDTDTPMLIYPTIYTKKATTEVEEPEAVLVYDWCYEELEEVPDYYFTTPPSSIEVSEEWWESFTDKSYVKWTLTTY